MDKHRNSQAGRGAAQRWLVLTNAACLLQATTVQCHCSLSPPHALQHHPWLAPMHAWLTANRKLSLAIFEASSTDFSSVMDPMKARPSLPSALRVTMTSKPWMRCCGPVCVRGQAAPRSAGQNAVCACSARVGRTSCVQQPGCLSSSVSICCCRCCCAYLGCPEHRLPVLWVGHHPVLESVP